MRDIVMVAVFAYLLLRAMRETWIGALLWTWLSLMNPHRLTYGFAYSLPYAQITAITTLASILWSRGKVRLPADGSVIALILFVLWTCVTTFFAILPGESSVVLEKVLKIQLMTLVCIAALRERKHIELFVWVNVLSIGFYGVKGGIAAIASGGSTRIWGPADSFIQDNNTLGLALVVIIPLGVYLYQVSVRRWQRAGMLVFLLLCSAAALSTQSRGAFLAITAMTLVLWMRARKKLVSGVVLVLAASAFIAFMPSKWEDRMRTIETYQEDTSALQRINAWQTAINIANDRPTGAGFAVDRRVVFDIYSPRPEWVFTAHSIYFQALGEHGWIGLILFLSMGALSFRNASQVRSKAGAQPDAEWAKDLCGMIQVSMVGFAVGGAFLSLAYYDLPYNIMVMLIACKYWVREERWKDEKVGVFGATSASAAAQARSEREATKRAERLRS
jgi:putative inorganic carbon (hco3(-)) transporter